ncbi:helix-turn-helix domain-containing protein [Promicromonospora sp. CA-289599]|uniref:helix-turn-helix domain-containing protein n=1 Tax=Promicromonospora sp. CA-289599 TaxID=3240014 RepID=UPI003D91C683
MAARSVKAEQRALVADLRAHQRTWAEIATVLSEKFGVNLRAAMRMVHGWSQQDAADRWNERWPNDPKTFKNFSYWEQWPAPTGHAPSLDVLARLAELYDCSLADLVADCADYRHRDGAFLDVQALRNVPKSLASDTPEGGLEDLLARLDQMDIGELARTTTVWAARLGTPDARRSVLLKLSAGLSLAAASTQMADEVAGGSPGKASVGERGFEGIWHSRYRYRSSSQAEEQVDEHYLVARQQGRRLVAQGLPQASGSEVRLELALDPPVATGTWRETTAPDGHYRGATYHGALQMVIDPSGRSMHGMWLGFGRRFNVNAGEWTLTWQERSISKSTQREYYDRT